MIISTGHFNLFPILEFASVHPALPSPQDKVVQKKYSKLLKELAKDVPQQAGWYLWGRFNDMGWWETIYLGKAGKQKTSSLHTRIYGELRDEGVIAFWSQVYGREPTIKQLSQLRGGKWDPSRSLRKTGSHFVIWIAADASTEENEIRTQEDILIRLYRPTHNSARWNQSAPQNNNTAKIEQAIEAELKAITNTVEIM